ncbi:MAG: RNA methyltransferase [Thermodesulfovibrionales bacterium]|jgi:TrmH family RNA methyltransferase
MPRDLIDYGMDDWMQNIYFVLVEPKEPGNIGASARAIKNMGFKNLCLVKPPAEMSAEGRWFARNAHDVLDSAEVHDSVDEAIVDKSIIVGTTRRVGKSRGVILPVEEAATRLCAIASSNKVAILFGREAKGLSNDEVKECGFMITIPSSRIQPSLNLAQAVLIVAYELAKCGQGLKDGRGISSVKNKYDNSTLKEYLAEHGVVDHLYVRISSALEFLEYIPRGDKNLREKIITNLKHFIGRAGLTEWEINMLQGICTQIEKKVVRR